MDQERGLVHHEVLEVDSSGHTPLLDEKSHNPDEANQRAKRSQDSSSSIEIVVKNDLEV